MNLAIHSTSRKHLEAAIIHTPHALLLTGPHGIGASTIAHHIAVQLSQNILTILPEKDEKVDLESGTITVGLIRRLYEQTRTQVGDRVVVIDYAERMAVQAQNAFLKLLEEPGSHTSFILVSHDSQKLLPTIHSRVQHIELREISTSDSTHLIEQLGVQDPTKRSQLLYMAQGLPAKITRLIQDEEYFRSQAQIVRDARDLLQGNPYDKLLLAHAYKSDRQGCLSLIDIALRMTRTSLASSNDPRAVSQLETLLRTYDTISANGNIRLQLARLVL